MNVRRRMIVFASACAAASASAVALRPSRRASEWLPPVELEAQVPKTFGEWSVDGSIIPILPDPAVQAKLDQIYNQVLARTYTDRAGRRVMLSIAYGADQGTDATAVHRPEFCYSSQGFVVRDGGLASVPIDGRAIQVRRLVGALGPRFEPITYWITLNDEATLPGFRRKLKQIALGLRGQIPDGMLVRVSTIGLTEKTAYAVQDDFIAELARHLGPELRARYFGRA